MATANLVLHIDEELDPQATHLLTAALEDLPGVTGTRHDPNKKHLFVVDYQPTTVAPDQLLEAARKAGYHGELVGL